MGIPAEQRSHPPLKSYGSKRCSLMPTLFGTTLRGTVDPYREMHVGCLGRQACAGGGGRARPDRRAVARSGCKLLLATKAAAHPSPHANESNTRYSGQQHPANHGAHVAAAGPMSAAMGAAPADEKKAGPLRVRGGSRKVEEQQGKPRRRGSQRGRAREAGRAGARPGCAQWLSQPNARSRLPFRCPPHPEDAAAAAKAIVGWQARSGLFVRRVCRGLGPELAAPSGLARLVESTPHPGRAHCCTRGGCAGRSCSLSQRLGPCRSVRVAVGQARIGAAESHVLPGERAAASSQSGRMTASAQARAWRRPG